MAQDVEKKLVEFVVNAKLEDIPADIVEFNKCLLLKTVSGMLQGADKPSGKKIAKIIKEQKKPEEVTVYGTGFKTSLWDGVFLNAYTAHASELEDDRIVPGEGVAWNITVLPLVLPLAEKYGLSGKDALLAMIIGMELHMRVDISNTVPLGLYVVPGAVGPAIGGAKALGLSAEEIEAVIGLTTSSPAVSRANVSSDAHFFESALQSMQAVMAVEMAKEGLKGNCNLIKYLSELLGEENVNVDKMLKDLGKTWLTREIMIKKWGICTFQHRQVDLILEMMKDNNLTYDDIEYVEVHASPADTFCDNPNPKDENDCQFSYQHNLGVAMLDGDIGMERISIEGINDPKVKEARTKVKFILHPELSAEMHKEPAKLVIKTKDGKEISGERQHVIGGPEEPLTLDRFEELYAKYTRSKLSEKDIARSYDLVMNLEKADSVKELMDILK